MDKKQNKTIQKSAYMLSTRNILKLKETGWKQMNGKGNIVHPIQKKAGAAILMSVKI